MREGERERERERERESFGEVCGLLSHQPQKAKGEGDGDGSLFDHACSHLLVNLC